MFCTRVKWKGTSGMIQPAGPGCDMVKYIFQFL